MKQLILFLLIGSLSLPVLAQESLFWEATNAYAEGDYEKALSLFNKVLEKDSLNIDALRYSGYSMQNLGQFRNAARLLNEAIEISPGDVPMRLALARSYENSGQSEEASLLYYETYRMDTTRLLSLGRLAQFLFEEKRWVNAKEMLERQLLMEPTNSLVLLRLGIADVNLGNTQAAVATLQTAYKMAPENAEIANQLSLLFVEMDLPESALKVLETGLRFHKGDTRFHKRTGDILFKQRRFNEARTSYVLSVQFGDSSAGTLRSLGASEFFLNNLEVAKQFLQRSAELDETEASTSYYLGLVWQKLGEQDSSITSFEKAIMLSRAKFISDALTQMSVSYELKKDLAGAVASLKKAISLTPENKLLLFYLASFYDRHYADRSEARKYYEEFIRTAPEEGDEVLQQAVRRLRSLREEEHFRKR